MFRNNDLVLFQGDSITDAVREYDNPDRMGKAMQRSLQRGWVSAHPTWIHSS